MSLDANVGLLNNILKFTLDLTANPLNCNCDLIWIVDKVRINQISLAGTCMQPDSLRGLPLNEPLLPHLRSCPPREDKLDEEFTNDGTVTRNVIIGDNVILNCNSANRQTDSDNHISWYQDDLEINFKSSTKFQLYSNGSLKIRSLFPKDESIYTCRLDSTVAAYDLRVIGMQPLNKYLMKMTHLA